MTPDSQTPAPDLLQELHALLAMWNALAARERAKAATPGRADDMPAEWRYLYADAMETARVEAVSGKR